MTHNTFEDIPLAVIGMACRFPGADTLDEYWRLLIEGRSSIAEMPRERFDPDLFYDPRIGAIGKSYTRIGGTVHDRPFDRDGCPIPEALIAGSDPAHLTMLEVAAAACRHAGLDPFDLPLRRTGVYIGNSRGSTLGADLIYSTRIEEVVQDVQRIEPFASFPAGLRHAIASDIVTSVHRSKPHRSIDGKPEVAANAIAGLVAEAFGLNGPYMAVDAACASALFAVSVASHELQAGRIDMALVGGAAYNSWISLILFSQAQALSRNGSFPFDARADGFVSSDGYAAIVVKTLRRALADGDPICGVIRGIGVSSDGRGKSLWAPRKEGQIRAIQRAYDHALDPARIQYVEAHATSTQLGDATEVAALTAALKDALPPDRRIPISSVKANIGHTCETAGMAGLIKTLLAMQHGVIPGVVHFDDPSPQIDWQNVPFFVPVEPLDWTAPADGGPRCAGVDAFGIGGLNAHVVVEQGPRATDAPDAPRLYPAGSAQEPDDLIAVIGIGSVLPGARTASAYWELLRDGRDPKSHTPPDRWDARIYHTSRPNALWRSPTDIGGFVGDWEYDWQRHRIPPKQLETGDLLQFMLLDTADQALRDAGYDQKPFDRARTGVVVGTIIASDFSSDLSVALHLPEFERELDLAMTRHDVPQDERAAVLDQFRAEFQKDRAPLHDETASFSSSTLASRIAKTLDVMGGAFVLDAGEASSLAALAAASDLLRSGACDMVLCAAGQRNMAIDSFELYALSGLIAPDTPRAGFDRDAKGFTLGEGAGMLLLKRLRSARRDGDRIRAVVRGVEAATDTASPAQAIRLSAERALSAAGVTATDVGVIEAAGTGVPRLDQAESEALADAYGRSPRNGPVLVDSVVGQIGHTLGASGIASMLKLLLAFEHEELPATAMLHEPAPSLGNGSALRVAAQATRLPARDTGGLAAVSALAFRGQAYHAIVDPLPRPTHQTAPSDGWRIVRLEAATFATLVQQIAQRIDEAPAVFAAAPASRFRLHDGARLALVVADEATLTQKLKLAADQIARAEARVALEEQGIFVRDVTDQPRIACLFPGQGSQYPGMLRDLVEVSPAAAAKAQEIDATMTRLGHPTFAQIAWSDDELSGDVWRTQISLLIADLLMYAALEEMGVRPDVVAGHSYGEYPALVVAGSWTLEQAIRVTHARCAMIVADESTRGAMLATTAPPAVVNRIAAGVVGTACVANHNAPDQTVVGGDAAAVAQIGALLEAEGYENRPLAVPRPFHTPLMAGVREPLRQVLEPESLRPPRIPLLSSVTNRYVADPLDIKANLVAQFVEPVKYVDLVERLARDGVRVFVECGPRQVLTRLHRRILPDEEPTLIAADHPKRSATEQLLRVRAALECAGARLGDDVARAAPVTVAPARLPATPIVHFDATVRRRQTMRSLAEARSQPVPDAQPTVVAEPADELETFLVNFVCEQTGYPPQVVHLDADLEADLGIDSLKKARLFAELGEHFAIPVASMGSMGLGDYPTLRHVIDFLRSNVGAARAAPPVANAGVEPQAARREVEDASPSAAEAVAEPVDTAADAFMPEDAPDDDEQPLPEGDGRTMSRWVLRVRDVPLPAARPAPRWHGPALILGDNAAAHALRAELERRGATVATLPLADDPDIVLAALERLWEAAPAPHLFITTACDPDAAVDLAEECWDRRRERGLVVPYLVCQRWTSLVGRANLIGHATLVAVTALGGNFGFEGGAPAVEGGGLAGLLKSIRREFPDLRVKVIDIALTEPTTSVASGVCDELAVGTPEVEVGILHGRRRLVRAIPRSASLSPDHPIERGSTWVVTGGARGITAIVARELGLRYDLVLHLIGSSPVPEISPEWHDLSPEETKRLKRTISQGARREGRDPVAAWSAVEKAVEIDRNLRRFAECGVRAQYHPCDVADRRALAQVLDTIRAQGAPIHGVIHGAGVESASRYDQKQIATVRATIRAKVDGAAALMALTRSDPLRYFVAFGSVSGRFGGLGQTDYGLSSDMLAKLVQWYQHERRDCAAAAVEWPAWEEAGMSVRPETRLALSLGQYRFMPASEGVDHLVAELRAGLPEGETVILDHPRTLDHDRTMPGIAARHDYALLSRRIMATSLLAGVGDPLSRSRTVVEICFDPTTDLFLREHLYQGVPMLPVVAGIEALLETAQVVEGERPTALDDLVVTNGMRFFADRPHLAQVVARRGPEGMTYELRADFAARSGELVEPNRLFMGGVRRNRAAESAPPSELFEPPEDGWHEMSYPDAQQAHASGLVLHGDHFRALTHVLIEDTGAWGKLLAPDAAALGGTRAVDWLSPAALLDGCLVVCAVYARTRLGVVGLPHGFERLRFGRMPARNECCVVKVVYLGRADAMLTFDFTLYGADGAMIGRAEGHRYLIILDEGAERSVVASYVEATL